MALARLIYPGLVSGEIEPRPTTLTFPADLLSEFWPFFEAQAVDWDNNRVRDFTKLAVVLKSKPYLLWHPLILRMIRHLRNVRRLGTDEIMDEGALKHICMIIEAAASGLLGGTWGLKPPGWSLKPPPGRAGRKPHKYRAVISSRLADEADYLKKSLHTGLLQQRHKLDSKDRQIRRVAALVQQVWEQSPLAREEDCQPTEFGVSSDDREIRWKEVPPPPMDRIIMWVRKAFDRRTESGYSIAAQLTWKMLAYHHDISEGSVRGAPRRLAEVVSEIAIHWPGGGSLGTSDGTAGPVGLYIVRVA